MFVGHAFLAFGLVALLTARYGPGDRPLRLPGGVTVPSAVAVGLTAALFASLPDVDVVHAAFQVVTLPDGSTAFDHFWAATSDRHRTTTHSLVVALLASVGFASWMRRRWVGGGILACAVALTTLDGGLVGGAVMVLFTAGGLLVVVLAVRTGISTQSVLLASLAGLSIHPFTDLLTGEPPAFFAPWSVTPISSRVEPFADATLNLLVAFGAELVVIWFGLLAGMILLDIEPRQHVHYVAVLGIVYAPMALILQAPSVDNAVPFVATILPVGVVGIARLRRPVTGERATSVLLTGLGAMTVAWLAFGIAYVVAI